MKDFCFLIADYDKIFEQNIEEFCKNIKKIKEKK